MTKSPALVDWGYSQTKAAVPSVVEPVDNSVWGMVISSLTAGRPPGQDGNCGYWWKTFYQLPELLRQVVWHMLEGDANSIPTWLVGMPRYSIFHVICHGELCHDMLYVTT